MLSYPIEGLLVIEGMSIRSYSFDILIECVTDDLKDLIEMK